MSKALRFDNLYHICCEQMANIIDHRGNNITYPLIDVLKSGVAIFSLKSPSLLSFESRSVAQQSNMHRVYKIEKYPQIHRCVRP